MNVEELKRRLQLAKNALDQAKEKITQEYNSQKNQDEYDSAYKEFYLVEKELAIITGQEYVIPHFSGLKPSPSGSGEVIIQTEGFTFVVFVVFGSSDIAIVECAGCSLTKFGYPNDEGRNEHPLYDKGLNQCPGIGEVINSTWKAELDLQTEASARRIHRNSWDSYLKNMKMYEEEYGERKEPKHFIFEFKENTFECIATELKITISDDSYEKILSDINKLILHG